MAQYGIGLYELSTGDVSMPNFVQTWYDMTAFIVFSGLNDV